jgi:hypothetical protein
VGKRGAEDVLHQRNFKKIWGQIF